MASDDWERHKATILNLFLLEKTPLHQVVSYMETNHNFVRTKAQYDYQLRNKWSIKKNANKRAWQYAAYQVNKRRGKKSEITFFGIPVPEERARREIQRYTGIPTANEFGARLPSPEVPGGMVIRVKTPSPMELDVSWPSTLPWFLFKNRVLPTLHNPSGLLKAFLDMPIQYEGLATVADTRSPLCLAWENPLGFRQAIRDLSDAIPNDLIDRQQLVQNKSDPCLVTGMLKVIFFSLSNNLRLFEGDTHLQDQFLISLVRAVSHSNPEMLSVLFSSNYAATKAIKEAVYGSAIREENYEFVARLLESGVNPDLPISTGYISLAQFERGIFRLQWDMRNPYRGTGLSYAARKLDARLARMLLEAGANINGSDDNLLEVAGLADQLAISGDVVSFMQLLIEYGAKVESPVLQCGCGGQRTSFLFALAIAGNNRCLAEFLIEKGVVADLSKYSETSMCNCVYWSSPELRYTTYTPMYIAIILGDSEIVEQLLPPLLSFEMIKQPLVIACLVGNTATALKLLELVDLNIDLNNGWYQGVTPLVASAWNPDTSIAEMLLNSGANVGPTVQEKIIQTVELCPIHVAAYHGSSNLVQRLIDLGADFNVRYVYPHKIPDYLDNLWWLAPYSLSSPLQFALESGNTHTMNLFLSHLGLLSGDPGDDTLVSDVISNKRPQRLYRYNNERTAFEAAIEARSAKLVRFYFFSGEHYSSNALFSATWSAIESKDYTIFKLLAEHRPLREIDRFEASALALSILKEQWDLVDLLLSDPFLPSAAKSFYDDPNKPYFPDVSHEIGFRGSKYLTPLSAAFWSNNIIIVESMIQRGFTPRTEDITVLMEGRIGDRGIPDTIREVVWSEFPQHSTDPTCLRKAFSRIVYSGDMGKVREYSKLFESLNFGFTWCQPVMSPIALSTSKGDLEIVSYFLELGANPDYAPSGGICALEGAALYGHLNIIEFLLNLPEGVNPSPRIRSVTKALKIAAECGYLVIMGLLIERGADINELPNSLGNRTALQSAAENGRLDAVQLLLESGARLDGSMRLHYTRAVNLAMKRGHYAVADHLKQYGAWTEEDQRLCDRLDSDEWIDLLHQEWPNYIEGKKLDDADSVESLDDGSQDNLSFDEDYSDNGCEGNEEVLHGHHETGCAQTWQNGIGFMPTDPLDPSLVSEDPTLHGLTSSPWASGSRDFTTDIGGTCENSNMVQQLVLEGSSNHGSERLAVSIGRNIASGSTADNHATDKMDYTLKQAMVVRERTPDFNIPGMEISQRQSMPPGLMDMEWEAFVRACEFNSANDVPPWDFPDQGVADLSMPLTDPSDEQIMPSSVVEPEWVGPFTGAEPELLSDLECDLFTW